MSLLNHVPTVALAVPECFLLEGEWACVRDVDWVSSDRFLSGVPSHAAVVAAVLAGSNVSSSKEIVWTDLHSESDIGRNCPPPSCNVAVI